MKEDVYVSDIARPQQERVESFIKVLRDVSEKFKIGHMFLVYELERKSDGWKKLGMLHTQELQNAVGRTGMFRVEELLAIAWQLILHNGLPELEIGLEAAEEQARRSEKEAEDGK